MTESLIRVAGITKSFDGLPVLSGIDLTIDPGEVVVIRGRSGSGKTTLLSILAGWMTADAGTIRWAPQLATDPTAWDRVAIIPQTLGLLAELSIGENIALPCMLGTAATDGGELTVAFEIDHLTDRATQAVSLGEQQRAAIARALVADPPLLLADEPTSHLDPARLHLVWTRLSEQANQGNAVLAATHDAEALRYATTVYDLVRGVLHPV